MSITKTPVAVVICGLVIAISIAFAAVVVTFRCARAETFRDNMGREIGTATRHGHFTTFRDAMGRETGYSTTNGYRTTIRDRMGREIGTVTGRPR